MKQLFWCIAGLVLFFGTGCAEQPKTEFVGLYKSLATCRDEYAALDARVDAAGVRDALYFRVPGYPYLRTDRLTASYRHEIDGVDQVGGWIRRMREFDQEAREFEYINLGMTTQEAAIQRFRFLNCGRGLAGIELDDPAAMPRLVAAAEPPDEYSTLARTLGLYPLAVPVMRARIASAQEAATAELSTPAADLPPAQPLVLWHVKPVEDLALVPNVMSKAVLDELGCPGLVDSQFRALAEYHAPQFWMETADASDQPAAPLLTSSGPSADPEQPALYYQIGFTRFGSGAALIQISYFLWFKSSPSAPSTPIDGMIWRVTLDPKGDPLVYESLHASGRDHRWFPVQALARRDQPSYWREPVFVAPQPSPAHLATVRMRSGSHEIRGVTTAESASGSPVHEYELRRYEDLFTLPRPEGGSRSLFGPDGLVAGSHGTDAAGLLASGIREPGALRELGHHSIDHIGRQAFDDPFLMSEVFVPPDTPSKAPDLATNGP